MKIIPREKGNDEREVLTAADLASMLQCSTQTIFSRVAKGALPPARKIGGGARWLRGEILAALQTAPSKRRHG